MERNGLGSTEIVMKAETIANLSPTHITQGNLLKLREMIQRAKGSCRESERFSELAEKLEGAIVIQGRLVPRNIITMGSRVRLVDLDTSESLTFVLSYPDRADESMGKVSVLSTLGRAMLGRQVGDEIEWESDEGTRKLSVAKVLHQPESRNRIR
mgnify:CR=1 FL=1